MSVRDNDSTCKIEGIDFNLVASCTERNIIKVSAKREIFFDVFECTINGDQTLVLEKVDEVDMLPIVNIQFTRDNKIYTCEAVLIEDIYEEFIINEDNIYFNSYIPTESEDVSGNDAIAEQTFTSEVVEDYDVSDSDIDVDGLSNSNHIPYQDQRDTFIQLLDEQLNSKLSSLKTDFSSQLEVFLKEVNNGSNILIGEKLTEIDTVVEEKFQNLKEDIKHIEEFSKQNITEAIKKKISEIEGFFNTYLENIVADNEQREDKNLTQINNNLLKINTVEESLLKSNNSIDTLQNKIRLLEELESKIITLDDIKERFIDESRIAKESKNIIKFVTEKILELSDNIQDNSKKQEKKYDSFIDSIRVEDVKEVKTIIHDKIDEAQINQLKENLQSDIEKSLKGDIVSLKRYVEMSSGGGSVAKQFANGGTMDGNLNVNGNILSGGINLGEIFGTGGSVSAEFLPLSGGNLTGQLSSNSTIISETISVGSLSATTIHAVSSVVEYIDIKQYELSGFNVTGNISVSGYMDVTKNITLSGDLNIDGLANGRDIAADGIAIDNLDTDVIYLSGEILTKASQTDLDTHTSNTNNPHSVTAAQVGLGNVTDESKATMFTNPVFTGTINSSGLLDFGHRTSNDTIIRAESDSNDLTLIRAASNSDTVGVSLKYIGSGSDDENIFEIATDGGGSLKIDNSGDVGINTAPIDGIDLAVETFVSSDSVGVGGVPDSDLDIHVKSTSAKFLVENTLTGGEWVRFSAGTVGSTMKFSNSGFFGIGPVASKTDTSAVDDFYMDSDGKVGIGTNTPTEKLEVNGDLMLQQNGVIKNLNNNTQFRFGPDDLYLDAGHLRAGYSVGIRGNRGSTKGMEQGSTLNSDLGINCGGNEAISIHSDGDTLINNALEVEGTTTVGKITLSDNSFVVESSSFTLGSTHRGATVLLQNTGAITITVPQLTAGHTTTFIAETSNSVVFTSGTGLSAFNSFNSANQIAGIFGQAQIIFKSSAEAFLGGNVV